MPDYRGIATALSNIGYSIATNGTTVSGAFDTALERAIRAFQQRYFSGANIALRGANFALMQLDFETAVAIQQVAADV